MKNIIQRTISGIIYLSILIGSLFAGKYVFGLVFLLINLVALYEFYGLARKSGASPFVLPALLAGALVFVLSFLVCSGLTDPAILFLILPLIILLLLVALYSRKPDIIKNAAITFLGISYISVPLSTMNLLAFPAVSGYAYTHRVILGILTLVWVNDTSAYLSGISLGRHRLFGRVSPKKSWEGTIGGTVLTFVCAMLMHRIMGILERPDWLAIALIVSVFGVYGDLTESMFKRSADLKDSGSFIPGHGGILDRIDSVLFVMPLSLVYLTISTL